MFRRSSLQPIAVVAVIAANLLALGGVLAADPNRLAWAPTREDAIVIDGVPSQMMPESSLSPSLMSQRPGSLSRPTPGRTRTYISHAPGGVEQLPTMAGTPKSPDGLPVPPEMYYDDGGTIHGELMSDDPCCNGCNKPGCNWCGRGCTWIPLCLFVPLPSIDNLEVFSGAQGYTGPLNRGGSGSFGFHEGFNWGVPIGGIIAGQWGANWTQSNFDGNYLTGDQRNQIFATAGLFRRVDWGLQGGVVFDYLHDEWDYTADLGQIRAELSWLWCGCNEIGVWTAIGVNDANDVTLRQPITATNGSIAFRTSPASVEVNDLFAIFFRRQFACGGQGRMFGGFTNNSQGLVGGEAQLPINDNWSLRSNFMYVMPGDSNTTTDQRFANESWNVGVTIVWNPCGRNNCNSNYGRPLFNVADNGSFITRLVR